MPRNNTKKSNPELLQASPRDDHQPLAVLIVEDSELDAGLMARELQNYGYLLDWQRVETASALLDALGEKPWDLVISDYAMPQFNGLEALQIVKSKIPKLPFLLVSGTIGEENAVEAMRAGAYDYLIKDRLARLGPAVARALQESQERLARHKAEEALRLSEERYRTFVNASIDMAFIKDSDFRYLMVNQLNQDFFGLTEKDILGKTDFDLMPAQAAQNCRLSDQQALNTGKVVINIEKLDNHIYETRKFPVPLGNKTGVGGLVRDITEQKLAEESLRINESRLKETEALAHIGSWDWDVSSNQLWWSEETYRIYGIPTGTLIKYEHFLGTIHPADRDQVDRAIQSAIENKLPLSIDYRVQLPDGAIRYISELSKTISNEQGNVIRRSGSVQDITDRVEAVKALRDSEERYRQLVEYSDDLIFSVDREGVFHTAGGVRLRQYGLTPADVVGKTLQFLAGDEAPEYLERHERVFESGEPYTYEHTYTFNNITRTDLTTIYPIKNEQDEIKLVGVICRDITDRQQAEAEIRKLNKSLAQRVQQLTALRKIDQTISSSLDLRPTLNTIVEQSTAQLNADSVAILLYNPYSFTLEYAAGNGFRTRLIEQTKIRLGIGQAGRAALEQRLVSVADLSRSEAKLGRTALIQQEGFISHQAIPLVVKGQIKGVLEVFHRSIFTPDDEWREFYSTLATQTAIAIDNISLFESLQRSNLELTLAYDATIEGWSRALDLRDRETEGHTERVAELTLKLARAFAISDDEVLHMRRGALLHDIGKMGIPDAILHKPGPLSEEEWQIMRQHPQIAYEMLFPIKYLRPALDIPHFHHEKWAGGGYPKGLIGEQIPLSARIFAVVDVWDALTSDRPYRPAWTREEAQNYIHQQSGQHFDPQVVKYFIQIIKSERLS